MAKQSSEIENMRQQLSDLDAKRNELSKQIDAERNRIMDEFIAAAFDIGNWRYIAIDHAEGGVVKYTIVKRKDFAGEMRRCLSWADLQSSTPNNWRVVMDGEAKWLFWRTTDDNNYYANHLFRYGYSVRKPTAAELKDARVEGDLDE